MSERIRLDFGNLPLVEATLRATLIEPVKLTYSLINKVHDALREDFPNLSEPSRLDHPPGVPSQTFNVSPSELYGALYNGNDQGLSISIQRQVIVVQWLDQGDSNASPYPRFPALKCALERAESAMRTGSTDEFPPITVVNASYVNILWIAHSVPVVAEYLSALAHEQTIADAKQLYKKEVSWQEPDGIDLRYNIAQVLAESINEKVECFGLTTAAGSRVAEGENPWTTLQIVHDRLQVFFRGLISDKARHEWQLEEVPID